MLYRMTKDEECKIAYEEILQFIDRTICPPPDELPINVKVFFLFDLWKIFIIFGFLEWTMVGFWATSRSWSSHRLVRFQ